MANKIGDERDFMINISPDHASFKSTTESSSIKNFEAIVEYVDEHKNNRLQKNDGVITINKAEDFFFDHIGVINDEPYTEQLSEKEAKELINNFDKELKYFKHTIPLKIEKKLLKDNLLDEYIFSLLTVRNFANPYFHFKRKVTSLNPYDYETIANQWIFVTRTVFARLINALPKENRLDFVLQAIVEFETVDLYTQSFFKAIEFLKEYIKNHFISQGRLLVNTKEILASKFSAMNIPVESFSFADTTEEKSALDNIFIQASLFEKLFSIDGNFELPDKLIKGISDDKTVEDRFTVLFKNKPWPVNLRV